MKQIKSPDNNDFAAHMNSVRKAWIPLLSEKTKAIFKAMPKEARFDHYRKIDNDVNKLYIETLRFNREHNIKANTSELLDFISKTVVSELN